MTDRNRLANVNNPFQGERERVLFICSAGLLRSPTAAITLSQPPYNLNARAAGIADEFALIKVDKVLVEWAHTIVCIGDNVLSQFKHKFPNCAKPVVLFNISDEFDFMDPELVEHIKNAWEYANNDDE